MLIFECTQRTTETVYLCSYLFVFFFLLLACVCVNVCIYVFLSNRAGEEIYSTSKIDSVRDKNHKRAKTFQFSFSLFLILRVYFYFNFHFIYMSIFKADVFKARIVIEFLVGCYEILGFRRDELYYVFSVFFVLFFPFFKKFSLWVLKSSRSLLN